MAAPLLGCDRRTSLIGFFFVLLALCASIVLLSDLEMGSYFQTYNQGKKFHEVKTCADFPRSTAPFVPEKHTSVLVTNVDTILGAPCPSDRLRRRCVPAVASRWSAQSL